MKILARTGLLAVIIAAAFAGPLARAQDGTKNPVVAVVDGSKITLSDIERIRGQLPPQAQAYPMSMLFDFVIGNIVNTRLVANEARRTGLAEDAEIKRRLAGIEAQVLEQEYMSRQLAGQVTDAKLKARFQAFLNENPSRDEVHARHILVKTEAEAKAVVERLRAGEKFEKLARQLSTGPSGKNGGDLGYFTADRMVPPFSAAAFEIRPGNYTEKPVKTRFGWHVIKVEDRRATKAPSFEASKARMREEMRKTLSDEIIAGLRKKAQVEIFGPQGRPGGKKAK